jgi:hypothetical protein
MRKDLDSEEDKVVIGVLKPEAPKVLVQLESSKNSSKDAS